MNCWGFLLNLESLTPWLFWYFCQYIAPYGWRKIGYCISDINRIQTHNHLVSKLTLNRVLLRTKWLWIWILLLSLKIQVRRLLRARSSLTLRQTIEFRFTLKLVRDMKIIYSQDNVLYCFVLQALKNSSNSFFHRDYKLKKPSKCALALLKGIFVSKHFTD